MHFEAVTNEGYVGYIDGDHLSWKVIISTDDESEYHRVRVTSILPVKVSTQTRNVMAELFARMNCDLAIGSWDLDMSNGEISYGICIDLMDGKLTSLMFERMLGVSLSIVDESSSLLLSVMHGGVKAADAFTAYQAKREDGSLQ